MSGSVTGVASDESCRQIVAVRVKERSVMARSVFYSFHYERDVHRVQLVLKFGALQGQPLLNAQDWENVRARGNKAVEEWIDDQMAYKQAVIVLVGQETASRPWVRYEIDKAWKSKKPLLGIRVHGLSSMGTVDKAGTDPFPEVLGVNSIPLFDPTVTDLWGAIDSKATYNNLWQKLPIWAERGVRRW